MRLAVAATPQVAIPTLEFLHSGKDSLVRIFTTEDKAIGRGRTLTPSDVAIWANEHGVECVKVSKANMMAEHLDDIEKTSFANLKIKYEKMFDEGTMDFAKYSYNFVKDHEPKTRSYELANSPKFGSDKDKL